MALLGVEYLIVVMTVFPLLFVVLVLFLFGEMTRNVITRTELLPLPSATFMAEEGPSHGRRGSFLGSDLGPSTDIDMGFPVLYPHNNNVIYLYFLNLYKQVVLT